MTASYEGTIATVNKAVSLTATVENGISNLFNDSTVRWHVYPKTGGTVSGTGKTAAFTPTEKGTYTIFFSGENRLGTVGRQFVEGVVIATPYDGPPIHGVPYRYHGVKDRCRAVCIFNGIGVNYLCEDNYFRMFTFCKDFEYCGYTGAWGNDCKP